MTIEVFSGRTKGSKHQTNGFEENENENYLCALDIVITSHSGPHI